jgi:DNA primase
VLRGRCPCCNEGGERAFVASPEKGSFYCFTERHGGDVIELAARFYRIPQKEAAQRIALHFGLAATDDRGAPESKRETRSAPELIQTRGTFDAAAYQASLDPAHPALKDCGIAEETIREFGGGYCSRGLHRGRLVLPVHDADGAVLGFLGLALKGEEPDVLLPKGFKPPPFFNLQRISGPTVCFVPSLRDALREWDAGTNNVICALVPMTPEILCALSALLRERRCDTIEFY